MRAILNIFTSSGRCELAEREENGSLKNDFSTDTQHNWFSIFLHIWEFSEEILIVLDNERELLQIPTSSFNFLAAQNLTNEQFRHIEVRKSSSHQANTISKQCCYRYAYSCPVSVHPLVCVQILRLAC